MAWYGASSPSWVDSIVFKKQTDRFGCHGPSVTVFLAGVTDILVTAQSIARRYKFLRDFRCKASIQLFKTTNTQQILKRWPQLEHP
jgi:hypothetical protein